MTNQLQAKFNQLSFRERALVCLAVVASIVFSIYYTGLKPFQVKTDKLKTKVSALATALPALDKQLKQLQSQAEKNNVQHTLEQLSQKSGKTRSAIQQLSSDFLSPKKGVNLIHSALARTTEVKLIKLNNLPPRPLLSAEARQTTGADIFLHGIEMQLHGNYKAFIDFLRNLESLPKYRLWGELKLTVNEHPRATLNLTIYTMSLQPEWLSM